MAKCFENLRVTANLREPCEDPHLPAKVVLRSDGQKVLGESRGWGAGHEGLGARWPPLLQCVTFTHSRLLQEAQR